MSCSSSLDVFFFYEDLSPIAKIDFWFIHSGMFGLSMCINTIPNVWLLMYSSLFGEKILEGGGGGGGGAGILLKTEINKHVISNRFRQ